MLETDFYCSLCKSNTFFLKKKQNTIFYKKKNLSLLLIEKSNLF